MPNSRGATTDPTAGTTGAVGRVRPDAMVLPDRDATASARAANVPVASAGVRPEPKAAAVGRPAGTGPVSAGMNRASAVKCRRRCRRST
jgi:hypothetical protein